MYYEPMKKISLYIAYEQAKLVLYIPKSETLIPFNSNATCGENIGKLPYYCELRVQYWVWKNVHQKANNYVGFFHYRRYLDFNYFPQQAKHRKMPPYRFIKAPHSEMYTEQRLLEIFQKYDIIAPKSEYTGIPVWIRYSNAAGHSLKELVLARKSISKHFPGDVKSFDFYMMGKREYFCNMFVMRRECFEHYCEWLFTILTDIEGELKAELGEKTLGYLGERLFGVYYTKCLHESSLRCGEVPRVHFWMYDDTQHHFRRNRYFFILFPPGSKRLAWIRRQLQKTKYREDEYGAYFDDCNSSI